MQNMSTVPLFKFSGGHITPSPIRRCERYKASGREPGRFCLILLSFGSMLSLSLCPLCPHPQPLSHAVGEGSKLICYHCLYVLSALTPGPSPTRWERGASLSVPQRGLELGPGPSPTRWERGARGGRAKRWEGEAEGPPAIFRSAPSPTRGEGVGGEGETAISKLSKP